MSHAYAVTNVLEGLSATNFTWSSGTTTNRGYVFDRRLDSIFYSSDSTEASVKVVIDFGGTVTLNGFAFLNHNMATWGSPTVLIEAATDAAITTGVVTAKSASSIATTAPNHKDCVLAFAAVTKRYWRITFDGAGSVMLSLGEMLAFSSSPTLSRKKIYGHGEQEEFVLNKVKTMTGQELTTFLAGPIRTKKLPFADLSTSEKAEVMAMWRASYGGSVPMLWIESLATTSAAATEAEQECVYGKLTETLGWTESDFSLYGVTGLEIRSLGREVGA